MKKAIVAVLLLFAVSSFAAEPDGWHVKLYFGETITGGLLGFGLGLGLAKAFENENNDSNAGAIAYFSGVAAGNTAGVLLIGELFGARSENWYITYPITFCAASVLPIIGYSIGKEAAGAGIVGIGAAVWAGLVPPIITPTITGITYNLVKKPKTQIKKAETEIGITPYTAMLVDHKNSFIPIYGVTVSF